MKQLIYKNAALFSALWAIIIFILCATPGQYIPSADWLELLSFDKLVHASIFFILTALFLTVAVKYNQSNGMVAFWFCLAVLYGGSLEIMQARWFSNRSADWADMAANSFGCSVALLLFKRLKRFFEYYQTSL